MRGLTGRKDSIGKRKASIAARLILAVCFALALLVATGCSSQQNGQDAQDEIQNASGGAIEQVNELRVGSMKGPTSIGLADMIAQEQGQFTIAASADEIAPKLMQGELDIALIPANLAATLYQKSNGAIRVIDINTLGVLYAVSAADVGSIDDLRGRTVYMTGKGTVPEYTITALLEASNIPIDDIDLQFCSEPAEVAALVSQNHEAVGILPQPYATSATLKDETLQERIDLTAAWEQATGGKRGDLITGVTIAKASTIEEKPEIIAEFLRRHKASTETAQADPDSIAKKVVELGIIDNEKIAQAAIPRCNVAFISGQEMKDALAGYLEVLYSQNPDSIGGILPDDSFYYLG